MNASHILLNHFSQRYPKLPKLNLPTSLEGAKQTDISISFDFMSIKVGDMWKMAHYMDALSILFDEAEPEDGDDTQAAVEGDINPTTDPARKGGKGKGKGKQNHSRETGGGGGATEGDASISKKAQKRAERKEAQRLMDEEKERNDQNASGSGSESGDRERSPGVTPDAKRIRLGKGIEA
jgi:ribonuclease Z